MQTCIQLTHLLLDQVTVKTDDMDLAGDVIQALCLFLNIDDLQVIADFPNEMASLQEILIKVRLQSVFVFILIILQVVGVINKLAFG